MKKVSLVILVSLSALMGAVYARSDNGVTMSTDPAKAADVERRAQELQSRWGATSQGAPSNHQEHYQHHIGSQPGEDKGDTGFDLASPKKRY